MVAVQKWLGHKLTAEQDAAVAEYQAARPPHDPAAPVDMSGWSRKARATWGSAVVSVEDVAWLGEADVA